MTSPAPSSDRVTHVLFAHIRKGDDAFNRHDLPAMSTARHPHMALPDGGRSPARASLSDSTFPQRKMGGSYSSRSMPSGTRPSWPSRSVSPEDRGET